MEDGKITNTLSYTRKRLLVNRGNENMKKPNKLPRCAALDEDGKRCRSHSAIEENYFGNPEHYNYSHNGGIEVHWVKINLCVKHAIGVGHNFLKK